MDPITLRAAETYHQLLRDEKGVAEELEAHFFEKMRAAQLTFGGRVLCPFPRPQFIAPSDYEQIRSVCRHILQAIEKVETGLGQGL
ncbi:MAG: hypothetical protein ACHQNV_10125, partial [Vicinamibacteria bacterium]